VKCGKGPGLSVLLTWSQLVRGSEVFACYGVEDSRVIEFGHLFRDFFVNVEADEAYASANLKYIVSGVLVVGKGFFLGCSSGSCSCFYSSTFTPFLTTIFLLRTVFINLLTRSQ
jgi:hypothetical protein